ncbi:MAG: hypothetical protein SF339_25895 [Blastocatellia bacterium]|nr:hypothetical protein [Blastocatellia bacterium]
MPEIKIKREDIKAGATGDGALSIEVLVPNPLAPLAPTETDLFRVGAETGGNRSLALGSGNSVKLGLEAGANCRLVALWKESSEARRKPLAAFDLAGYFDAHPDRVLLVFQAGASAETDLSTKVRHGLLSASATLRAGVEARYSMVRSAPANTPAEKLIRDFFAAMSMPGDVATAPTQDQVIIFEYGGHLNFKAGVNFGYEMTGAPSFAIGDLALSQKVDFALAAKLTLGAKLVGNFKVVVREGGEPGWGRVTIRKSAARGLAVGATVDASATVETAGWPESANELLATILGLQAKNWLNLFDRLAGFREFSDIEAYVDNLAKVFIGRATGAAFDELRDRTKLDEFLARVHEVTTAYQELGNHSVTLFDKYFDPVRKEVDQRLTTALRKIRQASTWTSLKAQVQIDAGSILWSVIQQLTEGDPFGWMTGEAPVPAGAADGLDAIRKRASQALDLIEKSAHEQLRRLIALAKSEFPLDHFLTELNGVTDLGALQARANAKLTAFVERVMGKALDSLATPEARDAVVRFHNVLLSIQKFRDTAFQKVSEALNQSFQFKLQAEYSRTREGETLFDFEFDLNTEGGRKLMREAGQGNFENVLAAFDREFVVLREGRILSRVTRESRFSMNILGWHRKWHFEGLDRLIVQADQRIQADGNGALTAVTTLDLEAERERKRQGERVYTNLLLRFIGESQDRLDFDPANKMYLIDRIRNMSARYKLILEDPETRPDELQKYLGFAAEFGLSTSGQEAFDRMKALLPVDQNGNFGKVSLSYDVRFTEKSLQALLHPDFYEGGKFKPKVEEALRRTMRLIVLTNYLPRGANFEDLAWAYWTPGVYPLRKRPDFTNPTDSREIKPIQLSPFGFKKAPSSVRLSPTQLRVLVLLYGIEDDLINGMAVLSTLVRQSGKIPPKQFEDALGDFGKALKGFDDLDKGDNTLFAIFDRLIQMAGGEGRNSSLTLTATLGAQKVTETLVA